MHSFGGLLGFCGVLGMIFPAASFGSAAVQLDRARGLVTVQGQIVFCGPQASETVAQAAATEVQTYWNGGTNAEPATQYFSAVIEGNTYQVVFEITHSVVSEAEARAMMLFNPGPELSFIWVLQGDAAKGDRSKMVIGSNYGVWYLSDDLGASTTAAHEYGHGLGLDHPIAGDWRGRGQPDIMSPRGEYVDWYYQYDTNADAGAAGGTINPYKRKVIQWDINNLQLSNLSFDSSGRAALNRPLAETPWFMN